MNMNKLNEVYQELKEEQSSSEEESEDLEEAVTNPSFESDMARRYFDKVVKVFDDSEDMMLENYVEYMEAVTKEARRRAENARSTLK